MEFNNFDLNLLTFLETNNLKFSDKNCFNYFGKWYKFEDLFSESYRYAKLLTKAGFKKGDRVALSLLGFPESIFLLFASSYIGLDIAMWDVRNNVESFRHLCTRIKPKAIFVCEWDLRFVLRISKEFKDINFYYISLTESINRTISNFRISFYALASFCVPYTKNVINFRSLCKLPITDIDLPLPSKSHKIYFPTSGSTGQSKYVILSSKHFNYQILQFFNKIQNHDINVVTNKSFLNFLPLFTSTGLLMHLNAMFLGIEQFIYPQPFPHRVWKWIIKNKVNYIFGPTKFYDDMMKYRFIKRTRDLSFLELLFCGGDILTERKEKQINEFLKQRKSKGQLINAYGLTETTAYISIQDKDKHTPGSCGKILPNVI